MKKLLIIVSVVLLTACSATSKIPSIVVLPNPKEQPKQLDRTEVIQAARECVNARMKPVIQNLPQPTDHGTIIVPVAVQCEVYGPTLR
jgi:PBP1b-binding outer membrane lipoprotein LpoB